MPMSELTTAVAAFAGLLVGSWGMIAYLYHTHVRVPRRTLAEHGGDDE